MAAKNQLKDAQGRDIKYLRISITDRCNFRCRYCMPRKNYQQISFGELLRYEDMLFAVKVFAALGVERVRVTGGEPLVRKDLPFFLSELHKIENIKEITLTTNAALLPAQAQALRSAGVRRLNISLDSLNAERYQYVTGSTAFEKVLEGIQVAKDLGFHPVKINSVVIRGFNDDEILTFCEFAAQRGVIVRFIEFMPIGNFSDWKKEHVMPGGEILRVIQSKYTLMELPRSPDAGPARNYRLSNGAVIGVITPMTEHFCHECDKLRLTADGKIRPCLLSDREVSVVDAVRAKDEKALTELIHRALGLKSDKHSVGMDSKDRFSRTMSKIGG